MPSWQGPTTHGTHYKCHAYKYIPLMIKWYRLGYRILAVVGLHSLSMYCTSRFTPSVVHQTLWLVTSHHNKLWVSALPHIFKSRTCAPPWNIPSVRICDSSTPINELINNNYKNRKKATGIWWLGEYKKNSWLAQLCDPTYTYRTQ